MKRREFLTASAAVAIPTTAAAAPLVIQEPKDEWEPTAYLGHMNHMIWQRWVNRKTGAKEWRVMPSVRSLDT